MKIGTTVIFFFADADKAALNNHAHYAPAVVTRNWGYGTVNLSVLPDAGTIIPKTSCQHANDLGQALTGNHWATIEECEAWGCKLDDGYNNPGKLLSNDQASEQPAAAEAQAENSAAQPSED